MIRMVILRNLQLHNKLLLPGNFVQIVKCGVLMVSEHGYWQIGNPQKKLEYCALFLRIKIGAFFCIIMAFLVFPITTRDTTNIPELMT